MTSRDRRSSGKCNPVENLCLGWNGVPNLTLGSFHCSLFLFVGHLSLLLHEHTFIPLLLFPESKLVLSHTWCAWISSRLPHQRLAVLPQCRMPCGIWLTVSWLGALPLYPLSYIEKKIIPPPLLESVKLSLPVPGLIQNLLPPGTLLW